MRISIIGCGNMGTAYARSFRKYGLVSQQELHLVLRREEQSAAIQSLCRICTTIDERVSESDLIPTPLLRSAWGSRPMQPAPS